VHDLLAAFATLRADLGATLVMVGDGAGAAASRALAERLGVNVRFVGAQPHETIPVWLAACDVLALPSWNEGMPNVVVEALACGRPVVATKVGGIPDVVKGDLGVLVAPRDVPALATALTQTLSTAHDPNAISAALDRPDWATSAKLLHASLLRALGSVASEAA
jgi:teichuronic acid biosynthesis glycosyltransferase TuaC